MHALSEPYAQRALLELLLLALLAGTLGTWIVLRRLAFFTHATGTAAFPGLVVAAPWGLPPQLGALGAALAFAAGVGSLPRRRALDSGAVTGALLVGALALGVVLASDVYESGAGVDTLLFGSLLGVSTGDLLLTGCVVVAVLVLDAALARRWTASGFDPDGARALGLAGPWADRVLLAVVAIAVVVAVDAVGALLAAVVLVVPAATARLLTDDLRRMRAGATVLALAEGVAGLWLADRLDVGPGPAVAVLGGIVFVAAAVSNR